MTDLEPRMVSRVTVEKLSSFFNVPAEGGGIYLRIRWRNVNLITGKCAWKRQITNLVLAVEVVAETEGKT